MMQPFESTLALTLRRFADYVANMGWYGREREAISAYAMGFLAPACNQGVLRSPAQIGIEVAVKQLPGDGRRRDVCKDLVIWPEPFMTLWGRKKRRVHFPLSILEWKRTKRAADAIQDRTWLQAFARTAPPTFVGFSVLFDAEVRRGVLRATRVTADRIDDAWLVAP